MSKWEMVKLKNIAMRKLEYGSGASAIEYDGLLRYIRITDINDSGRLSNNPVSPSTVDEKYKLKDGDILFARSGATVGKTFLYHEENGSCIYAGYLIRLVPSKKVANPKYVYYCTKAPIYQAFVESNRRVVAQPNINAQQYGEFQIPLPPLETQKQIAKTLDTAVELLAMRKQQLAELDSLIKSTFFDMFGDPVTNPMGWKLVKLGDVGELNSGGTPTRTNPNYFLGDIDWYSAGELNQRYLNESKEKLTIGAITNSAAKVFNKGSMLIGMYDTAAFKLGILTKDSSSNQACANIDVNKDLVNIEWLYDCAQIMRPLFLQNRRGVRQKNLNLGMIKNLEIPLPPILLQSHFASIVTKIEEQKFLVKKAIDETQYLFDSLMSEYFE